MLGTTHRLDVSTDMPSRVLLPRARSSSRRRTAPPRLLDQPLFRGALLRERQQADRFESTFGLVLVFPKQPGRKLREAMPVLSAVAAAGHDTDVYGWFEQDAVVGAIRWQSDRRETVAAAQSTVERELERALGAAAAEYRVRVYEYSPDADTVAAPLREAVINESSRPGRWHRSAKRLLDIAGSSALLLASSPLFLLCALLVKATSRGPIFFRQQRVGEHATGFTMLKFRTMHTGAATDLHQQYVAQFIQGGVQGEAGKGAPVFKIVGDPRVTKVGQFLRRTSLDELPQFWNVLRGDMSLVGPRPPLPYEVNVYKAWHRRRVLEAKPGITGLWQVTGRSRTTFDEMVRLDIRYARHQSVWTDVRILLATPRAVISGSGAL
jgi:lipopolysaccharide/colanic/teichoic acid biosynthesis glycosyltransferase